MGFIKLIINECIKIFKKKVTVIFCIIAVLTFVLAYVLMSVLSVPYDTTLAEEFNIRRMEMYIDGWTENLKTADEKIKIKLESKIEVSKFALENNIISGFWYKSDIIRYLDVEVLALNKINKVTSKDEYNKQKNKVDELKRIILQDDFASYVKYNKTEIEKKYEKKEITLDEYNRQISEQNQILKYEIHKTKISGSLSWERELVSRNFDIDKMILMKYDNNRNEYLNDNKIKEMKNEKISNIYRLDNNIPIFELMLHRTDNLEEIYADNLNTYYRFQYSSFASTFAMFVIALLFIILASSTVSDEISKGTIKFLIVTPFKRYKIIFAKIISLTITLIIITLIISQINVLVGNILFNAPNEYAYAENGVAKVLNTNIYETLQFILKTPEIFIYILFAMMLSTLLKNKIITNTITLFTFFISNFIVMFNSISTEGIFNEIMKQNIMKYLPITNFDFISKILPIYNPSNNGSIEKVIINNTLEFSLIVLGITAFLLIFTMLESFNKKDM